MVQVIGHLDGNLRPLRARETHVDGVADDATPGRQRQHAVML